MRNMILSLLAAGAFLAAMPAANAARRHNVIERSHHDRGLHRGWSHAPHWGARRHVTRGRTMHR